MTRWLLDASVIVASEDENDAQHSAARSLLTGDWTLHTLDLAYYETVNVAARRWRSEERSGRLRRLVDAIADSGGLVRVDSALAAQMAVLADQHALTSYDASYVAAAARVGATLVSCDLRDLVEPGHAITPAQAYDTIAE